VLALVGISLVLHFGLCSLATGQLQSQGYDVRPLFRSPLKSRSVAEFWSQRWNLAFSEMTSLVVYRPLRQSLGARPALWAGFALSGLLHEITISLPVHAGYGLPTLYFLLQALGVTLERRINRALTRRVLAIATVVLPLPILFQPEFLRQVVHPLLLGGSA
jgi:alginate O-acetyltransferase complex protein AlgI